MKPKTLQDFIGNEDNKAKLKIKIEACKKKNKALPNIGLLGPAGIGKTTLAEIIANELDAEFIYVNSTAVSNPISFRQYIADAAKGAAERGRAIVMLDEAHALKRRIQDNILSLFESPSVLCTSGFKYDEQKKKIVKEEYATLKEDLPEGVSFCLATTHPGSLSDALRSRLLNIKLVEYTLEELSKIAMEKSEKKLSDSLASRIGDIARSARDVVKICDHIDDICSIKNQNPNEAIIDLAINLQGYEKDGLTKDEIKYLKYLQNVNKSSLANLSSYMNISTKEIQYNVEVFLIRKGYIYKDTSGRQLTKKGEQLCQQV